MVPTQPYESIKMNSSNKPYDNGRTHAPWRKSAIIPIWGVQLTVLSVNVIALGLLVGITKPAGDSIIDNEGKSHTVKPGVQPWIVLNIVVGSIGILMTCLEISMFTARDLHPGVYLGLSIMKAIMWLVPLAFELYIFTTPWALERYNKIYIIIAASFTGILWLSFIVAIFYAAKIFLRYRKRMKGVVDKYISSETALMSGPYC